MHNAQGRGGGQQILPAQKVFDGDTGISKGREVHKSAGTASG